MGGAGGYGSLVDADSVLLALTPEGRLIVFEPGAAEFKPLASYEVSDAPTHAYPVLLGNRFLIKDKESLSLWAVE